MKVIMNKSFMYKDSSTMLDLLEYYETLVDGNINLLEPEEIDLIRSEREYIQDKIHTLSSKDIERLAKIDEDFKFKVAQYVYTNPADKLQYPEMPKERWWWHV